MKISRVDVYQIDLPYSGGIYLLSGGRSFSSFDATLVRITDDDGREGWGESTPFGSNYVEAHATGVRAGLDILAPAILGMEAGKTDRVMDRMDEVLNGHLSAKAPLDIACWDLLGKSLNRPVCELLGGRVTTALNLISSIHAGAPDDMRARVAEFRRLGYVGHSIKIGAAQQEGGAALDAERIKACLSDQQASEFFIVDANGGLSVEQALRMLSLVPSNLDFVLEAPCSSFAETRQLRARTSVPVFADELARSDQDVVKIITENLGEGVGLKISKNGGLTHCKRQRDFCLAAGLSMSVQDTVGSELSFAAILHLAHTVPSKALRCVLDTTAMVGLSTGELDYHRDGRGVFAGDSPGIGFTPDMAVLGSPIKTYQ